MIIGGLVDLLVLLLDALISLIPDYTPPASVDLSAFSIISWLIPVGEIINIVAVMVAAIMASLSYIAVNWLINKIRGSG